MTTTDNTALPDSSDMLALKALVPALVEACPDMYELARGVAKDILNKFGLSKLEPEEVYYHRFHLAQSSPATFTGWEHLSETPYETMTLPQLVIQRFRVTDQDNADLLDLYGGFYSADASAGNYNETNEIRLHGNDVLKEFWAINFAELFKSKVAVFWKKHDKTYRALAKCTYLAKAMEDRESGRLSDDNFRTVIKAVASNISWPVTRQMLDEEAPEIDGLRVTLLKLGGFVATDLLCIIDDKGHQIVYAPGEVWGFHACETPRDLHWWILSMIKEPADRRRFMAHFQVSDHDIMQSAPVIKKTKLDWILDLTPNPGLTHALHALGSVLTYEPHSDNVGLTHVLDLLFNAWNIDDHKLIDHASGSLGQDAFTFLGHALHARMISDGSYMLHSNKEVFDKLLIGYLDAFGKLFGPLAAIGWPVALVVVGAGLVNLGLNINQAVNGKTPAERKAGVIGSIMVAVDVVSNAAFLKGSGRLPEIAEADVFFAPEEQLSERAIARAALPTLEEIVPERIVPVEPDDYLAPFKTEVNDLTREDISPQKMRNIVQGLSGKNYIYMRRAGRDGFYQVRYVEQMKSWVIIDPNNPYSFYRNVPVRQNEARQWEPIPRSEAGTGLSGGGKIFGLKPWGETSSPLPKVDIPPTPYDLPEASRTALTDVAEGRTEDFPLDPADSAERPYQEFRDLRRGLYDDAISFYADPPTPPRPVISPIKPATQAKDVIKSLLTGAPGLVIGQESKSITGQQVVIDTMKTMNKQKVRTLYLDRLLTDIHQADLDTFHETGQMPAGLERYLDELDAAKGTELSGQYGYKDLVVNAQKNHIRVQAIDCMASARFPRMERTTQASAQKMKNYFSNSIISTDQAARGAHKWIALVEETRVNTYDGVTGLAELRGAPGLRIENVPSTKTADLGLDPGKKVLSDLGFPLGLLKSDLRLRVHGASPYVTARTVDEAIPRRGMFTIQQVKGKATLYHRSGSNAVVATDIQRDKGGVFIDYSRWPVSGRRYGSNKQLSEALQEQGMIEVHARIETPATPGGESGAGETDAVPGTSGGGHGTPPEPKAPRVGSPYDVSVHSSPKLKNAVKGFEDRLLWDSINVTRDNEAFADFKAQRKRLYEDANRFYADPQLSQRADIPSVDPKIAQPEFFRTLLEEFPAFVVGEGHSDVGSKQILIENMQLYADEQVKTLYMEHLLTDFHQAALDSFFETKVMPRDLEDWLKAQDIGHRTDPLERYNFLELVREANKRGIRVQAIDSMSSYLLAGMRDEDELARQKMMNFHARLVISADQAAHGAHKWIALMGNSHSNTYQGIAGVAELEGVPGVRVEDVAEGQSRGIEPDPGQAVHDQQGKLLGLVKGDLRLQVESPWQADSTAELETLLPRSGMYTLRRFLSSGEIVHRSRDNKLVYTSILRESGRYYIERPTWPAVSGKRFESVPALLEALDQIGLSQAVWPKQPLLKGTGAVLEAGAEVEAALPGEITDLQDSVSVPAVEPVAEDIDKPQDTTPQLTQSRIEAPFSLPAEGAPSPAVPQKYQCNEMLESLEPEREPGKYLNIYRLKGDPQYAILMDDNAYYVRFFADSEEGGYWAIVDPQRPNQFVHSLPVRLNADGQWERMRSLRLNGGGQCMGKECTVNIEMVQRQTAPPAPTELPEQPIAEPQPPTSNPIRLVQTPFEYDSPGKLKVWAMDLPRTHVMPLLRPGLANTAGSVFHAYYSSKRWNLVQAAYQFFGELAWSNLPPRPVLPDVSLRMPVSDLIDGIFAATHGLVVGETLDRIASMRFMIENMAVFSRHVKTLYVRRLLSDFAQIELNHYFETGNMTKDLKDYLNGLGTDPIGQFNELELVKTARSHGVRIQGIDAAAKYLNPVAVDLSSDQVTGNYLAKEIIELDQGLNNTGKWVVLTGAKNTNTFKGVSGISELEGGIGLRIEEVHPGEETGVDIDPGTQLYHAPDPTNTMMAGNYDTVYSDLRLRVEAPPVSWSDRDLRKLLRRDGMYLFEKSADDYTLIHRSQSWELLRTPVQRLAGGQFSIHRPTWPRVNDIAFPNLEKMAQQLELSGLTLQSHIPR